MIIVDKETWRKKMITIERASELVFDLASLGKREEAIDLFCHFVDFFQLSNDDCDKDTIEMFARLCKYQIASNMEIIE